MAAHAMTARRTQGRCTRCDGAIMRGDSIYWNRETRSGAHTVCPFSAPKTVSPLPTAPALELSGWEALALMASLNAEPETPSFVPANTVAPTLIPAAPASETRKSATIRRIITPKRPRPWMNLASDADLAWDPEMRPLHTDLPENERTDPAVPETERAGVLFAIVRPGQARWPLSNGAPSKDYRLYSHNRVRADIEGACVGQIAINRQFIVGQGCRVVYEHNLTLMGETSMVAGLPVTSRLVSSVPHTGNAKLSATIVHYVGDDAVGSVTTVKASHRASNPELWQSDVNAMINDSILVQTALVDLLNAANARVLTTEDRKWFRKHGMIVKNSARTALDAMRQWHGVDRRGRAKPTWGVWSRRLDDTAIVALCCLLLGDHAASLDGAIGGERYTKAVKASLTKSE